MSNFPLFFSKKIKNKKKFNQLLEGLRPYFVTAFKKIIFISSKQKIEKCLVTRK